VSDERAAVDAELAAHCERRDHGAATTLALRCYGSEILRFLVAVTRSVDDADEAFAQFCLLFWQHLPGFRRECSFRTWAYVLARTALAQLAERRKRQQREVPLSSEAAAVADGVRSQTREYLRSAAKHRLAAVIEKLDEDERMLLILRVQRKLSWADVARVVAGDVPLDEVTLARRTAALRTRFVRLKQLLRDEVVNRG
jgi:RNA polymerase sigma-70 factor (ECF subfamily)